MYIVNGGWHMDFDKLGYIYDGKIVVLQCPMLVLLASLVLHKTF